MYEGNLIENNSGQGIFHEVSFSTTIRYNRINGNGKPRTDEFNGAGILISNSAGTSNNKIEIYGNTLRNNLNGIVGIAGSRTAIASMSVYDNTIINSDRTGVEEAAKTPLWSTISFENNCYEGAKSFRGKNSNISWAKWQSDGNDSHGGQINPTGGCPERNSGI